jgi:hypothetical protein
LYSVIISSSLSSTDNTLLSIDNCVSCCCICWHLLISHIRSI